MFAPEIRANCRANEDYREWGRNEVHTYCDSVGPTSGKADITSPSPTAHRDSVGVVGCCPLVTSITVSKLELYDYLPDQAH